MMAVVSLILFFPLSFLAYSISERFIAIHETRKGKSVTFAGFVSQTWADSLVQLRLHRRPRQWLFVFLQFVLVSLMFSSVEHLVWMYWSVLGLSLMLVGLLESKKVEDRIQNDSVQVSYFIAGIIFMLCVVATFSISGNSGLDQRGFHLMNLLFVVPFQIAGMMLFSEHPFEMGSGQATWMRSLPFYSWSLFCAHLFTGGSAFVLDLHLKGGVLYFLFRQLALYFPALQKKDLLRISVLYLLPFTGLAWVLAMLVVALQGGTWHD